MNILGNLVFIVFSSYRLIPEKLNNRAESLRPIINRAIHFLTILVFSVGHERHISFIQLASALRLLDLSKRAIEIGNLCPYRAEQARRTSVYNWVYIYSPLEDPNRGARVQEWGHGTQSQPQPQPAHILPIGTCYEACTMVPLSYFAASMILCRLARTPRYVIADLLTENAAV